MPTDGELPFGRKALEKGLRFVFRISLCIKNTSRLKFGYACLCFMYWRVKEESMTVLRNFRKSLKELRNVRCIVTMGVFIAIFVILDGFCSIRIGEAIKINFAYLALSCIGMLFGPAAGFVAGFACDFTGWLVSGGGFVPGLALATALEGMIYGLGLYDLSREKSFKQYARIALTRLAAVILCNLIINTAVLYYSGFIGGSEQSFWMVVYARIGTNAVGYAISLVLLPAVLIPVRAAYNRTAKRI